MQKIPTIFERDWEGDRSRVTDNPTPAHALLEGAVPKRKRDGTACLLRAQRLYKRYDCKPGRTAPAGFEPVGEPDEKTGHHPGWVPVGDGPEDRWFRGATVHSRIFTGGHPDGTYELCGPKVQGNPEGFDSQRI